MYIKLASPLSNKEAIIEEAKEILFSIQEAQENNNPDMLPDNIVPFYDINMADLKIKIIPAGKNTALLQLS